MSQRIAGVSGGRTCEHCSAPLVRRQYPSQLEPLVLFAKRRFCNNACRLAHGLPPMPDAERHRRFWAKVDRSGGPDACWPWLGARYRYGYGRVRIQNKARRAHRVAWELTNGPLPPGKHVCHHCDTPPCCNAKHFFLGTNVENTADKVAKGRQSRGASHSAAARPPRGESSGRAKLTEALVREIRVRYAAGGVTHRQLAAELGMKHAAIGSVLRGRTWSHVQ